MSPGLARPPWASPRSGRARPWAAGLACLAVALPPVIRARDAFRLGTALVVLANAGLLLRSGLSGTSPALEVLAGGAALVAPRRAPS